MTDTNFSDRRKPVLPAGTPWWVLPSLGWLGAFIYLTALVLSFFKDDKTLFSVMCGAAIGIANAPFGYFFGSSAGSAKKDEVAAADSAKKTEALATSTSTTIIPGSATTTTGPAESTAVLSGGSSSSTVVALLLFTAVSLQGCTAVQRVQAFEQRAAPVVVKACQYFRSAENSTAVQLALIGGTLAVDAFATPAAGALVSKVAAAVQSYGDAFCANGPPAGIVTTPEQDAAWLNGQVTGQLIALIK